MFSILRKTCLILRIKKRNSYSNSSQQQCIEAIKKKKKIENGKKMFTWNFMLFLPEHFHLSTMFTCSFHS